MVITYYNSHWFSGTAPPMGKIKLWTLGNSLPGKSRGSSTDKHRISQSSSNHSCFFNVRMNVWNMVSEKVSLAFKHLNKRACGVIASYKQMSNSGGTLLAWWGNWDCERPCRLPLVQTFPKSPAQSFILVIGWLPEKRKLRDRFLHLSEHYFFMDMRVPSINGWLISWKIPIYSINGGYPPPVIIHL